MVTGESCDDYYNGGCNDDCTGSWEGFDCWLSGGYPASVCEVICGDGLWL